MQWRKSLWAVWLVLCVASSYAQEGQPTADQVGDELPRLDEIVSSLQHWRQSFASVQLTWNQWNREHFIESNPEADPETPLDGVSGGRGVFAWADWGALTYKLDVLRDGRVMVVNAHGTDRKRPWGAKTKWGEDPDH